jgi:hypothetical protein
VLLFCFCFSLHAQTSLVLSSGSASPGQAVSLNVTLSTPLPSQVAGLQWTFAYSSTDFSGLSVGTGPAAVAAGKSITCNGGGGLMICLVTGLNTNTIASGVVASATFTVSPTTGSTSSIVQLVNSLGATPQATGIAVAATGGTVSITQPASLSLSVTPSSGSGSSQLFSFVYSNSNGFADLPWGQVLINSSLSQVSGCLLHYTRSTNAVWLVNDANTAWLGPLTLGTAAILYNSQCVVNGSASSASGAGNDLTVNLALTFRSAFAGAKNIYMQTQDSGGFGTGWQTKGSWTATSGGSEPPSAVSVTPSSGSGSSQLFSFVFSDPNGFADLPWGQAIINATLSQANSCVLHYTRSTNAVWLVNDANTAWLGPLTLGATGILYNSQCVVNGSPSSATAAGNNLTVNLALTFHSAFAGAKNIYMQTQDLGGFGTGWQTKGSWTATTGGNEPPSAVSVTPSSGSGSSQLFSFVFSDPNGFADLAWGQAMINATLSQANSCVLHYTRDTNAVWLVNDASTAWLGPLTLGATGILYNSQCVVDGSTSSATGAGNNLTVNLALTLRSTFAGAKDIYMQTQDNGGFGAGWQTKGSWTATTGGNEPPSTASVTPSSGSGSSQTFSFVYSDPNGFADLPWVQVLINSPLSQASSCVLHYNRLTNQVSLVNDANTAWLGPLTLGAAGTLENGQCAVSGATSSASGSGTSLTVNLALSFKPAFAGVKTIYMQTQDTAGWGTGWQARGSWTVP